MVIDGRAERYTVIHISDCNSRMCNRSCQFLETRESIGDKPACDLFEEYLRETGEKDGDGVEIIYRHPECVRKFGNGETK